MTSHPVRHTVTGPPARSPAHAARPPAPVARVLAIATAGAALLAMTGLGVWAYLGSPGPSTSTPTSARLITVSPSADP